jgi:hypothetical protein
MADSVRRVPAALAGYWSVYCRLKLSVPANKIHRLNDNLILIRNGKKKSVNNVLDRPVLEPKTPGTAGKRANHYTTPLYTPCRVINSIWGTWYGWCIGNKIWEIFVMIFQVHSTCIFHNNNILIHQPNSRSAFANHGRKTYATVRLHHVAESRPNFCLGNRL